MAVDKGLYAAPAGLEADMPEESLEIEIVNPDMVTLDDGSVEITLIPNADVGDTVPFDANLADVLDEVACTLQCLPKQPYASKQKPCPRHSLRLARSKLRFLGKIQKKKKKLHSA